MPYAVSFVGRRRRKPHLLCDLLEHRKLARSAGCHGRRQSAFGYLALGLGHQDVLKRPGSQIVFIEAEVDQTLDSIVALGARHSS